jgi:hypothetical protein
MPGFMPSQPSSLPTNSSLRLAVLEDLADGAGGQRRVQRHRQTPPAIQMAKSAISQCARVLGRCSATAVAGLARPWPCRCAAMRRAWSIDLAPGVVAHRRRRPSAASARRGPAWSFSQWYRRCSARASSATVVLDGLQDAGVRPDRAAVEGRAKRSLAPGALSMRHSRPRAPQWAISRPGSGRAPTALIPGARRGGRLEPVSDVSSVLRRLPAARARTMPAQGSAGHCEARARRRRHRGFVPG